MTISASFIDNQLMSLYNYALNKLDLQAPLKKMRVTGKVSPRFSFELSEVCKSRIRAKQSASASKNPNDWILYRRLRNDANFGITWSKKLYFRNKFKNSTETKNLWNSVNMLTKFRIKPKVPINVLETDGKLVYTIPEITDCLAKQFVFKSGIEVDRNLNDNIESYCNSYDYSLSD